MKYLLFIILIISSLGSYAQSTDRLKEFNSSTTKLFVNVIEKISYCNSSIVMLKIDVDTVGNKKFTLSDNADSLLSVELNLAIVKLNVKPLIDYLKQTNISKSTFLLSVSFVTITQNCLKPTLGIDSLYQTNKFMNKSFMGPCIWLEPIGLKMTVQDN